MKPALPGATAAGRPNLGTNRYLLPILMLLLLFALVRGLFSHHETREEAIARQLTLALQNNDLAAVERFQNAETATEVNRAVVGRAADTFVPLGKVDAVRETQPPAGGQTHQFVVTFDKGTVHETIKFDPDDKVVGFRYDQPTPR